MDIIGYRSKIINIAKNLKYSGNYFPNQIILKIKKIINASYNLKFDKSFLIKQKFDIVMHKYQLKVINRRNNLEIMFHEFVQNTDMNILYRQLYDFLYKLEFVFNVINNLENIEKITKLLDDKQLDGYSVIPMKIKNNVSEKYNEIVKSNLKQQILINDIILSDSQYGGVLNQAKNSENLDFVRNQSYSIQQIRESNVKSLLD